MLEGLLHARQSDLSGILNGIDDQYWNPATDKHIMRNYTFDTLAEKTINKCWLQTRLNLPVDAKTPLLSLVSRLVEQKGIILLLDSLPLLMTQGVQLVVLGTGEEAHFEQALTKAAEQYPDRLRFVQGYNEPLSHQIFAASDIFLMPFLTIMVIGTTPEDERDLGVEGVE